MARNLDPEQTFLTLLTHLARVTKTELTEEDVALYDLELEPMGYSQVVTALKKIITERSARDPFPSVLDIRAVLKPEADPESEAQITAGKILQALVTIGPHQAERFKAFVGPLGWQVVLLSGGLTTIGAMETKEIPFHKAQWIKLGLALQRREIQPSEEHVAIEGPKSGKDLTPMSDILKRLEERKK